MILSMSVKVLFYIIFWNLAEKPQARGRDTNKHMMHKTRSENLQTALLPINIISPFLATTLYYFCLGQVWSSQSRPQPCCAGHCVKFWWEAPPPFPLIEIQKLQRQWLASCHPAVPDHAHGSQVPDWYLVACLAWAKWIVNSLEHRPSRKKSEKHLVGIWIQ